MAGPTYHDPQGRARWDSLFRGNRKFDREQLIFVCEAIMAGVMDQIDGGLPPCIKWQDRISFATSESREATDLLAYEAGVLEGAGMSLSIIYTQLTNEGLAAQDALAEAGHFDDAVRNFVADCWKNQGKDVMKRVKEAPTLCHITAYYPTFPDARKHAEIFVKSMMEGNSYLPHGHKD